MMTKKDFVALAEAIKEYHRAPIHLSAGDVWWTIPFTPDQLNVLACFCKQNNPHFNRERWLDYIDGKCGPNGGKIKQ